jgi:copper chaperone
MSAVAEDISCNHCKHTIESALGSYKGIQKVSVDVDSKTVEVDYDDTQVSWEEISSELAEIGYPVS